jgi:hypothetical protein
VHATITLYITLRITLTHHAFTYFVFTVVQVYVSHHWKLTLVTLAVVTVAAATAAAVDFTLVNDNNLVCDRVSAHTLVPSILQVITRCLTPLFSNACVMLQ